MRTAQGRALAERHRVAQGRLAQASIAQMLALWPVLMAGGRVDANTPLWLRSVLAVIAARRAESAGLASSFATAYRVVESGTLDGYTPAPVLTLNDEQFTTSLMVTGVRAYEKQVARQLGVETRELTPAMLRDNRVSPAVSQKMAVNSARAGMRHVLNGGRETLDAVMQQDQAVVGYMRFTDGDPCWFCAMLASRGPVYDDDSFEDSDPRFHGPGNQKVHDECGCMLVPMYRRKAAGDELHVIDSYRKYDALWRETGNARDFRKAFEARKPR